MKFEEKAQIEIIKTMFNPKKRNCLAGCYDNTRCKLVYTDNGVQIFTINLEDLFIDIPKCFPGKSGINKLLFESEAFPDLAVPTLQLRQMDDGRVLEEFLTVEGQARSMWVDRKLLARFEQPSAYMMGKDMLYLEDEQGVRYGAIMRGARI